MAALRSIPDTLDAFPRGCERVRRQVDETVLTHLGTESGVCAICASTAFSDITPTVITRSSCDLVCGREFHLRELRVQRGVAADRAVFGRVSGGALGDLRGGGLRPGLASPLRAVVSAPPSHLETATTGPPPSTSPTRPTCCAPPSTCSSRWGCASPQTQASFRRPKTVEDMEADCLVRSSVAAAAQDHRCQVGVAGNMHRRSARGTTTRRSFCSATPVTRPIMFRVYTGRNSLFPTCVWLPFLISRESGSANPVYRAPRRR